MCRDSRHRVIHDRRGDSATATSSSKGSRGQHLDETASAADAEHMAEASSLLEQLKAKTHSQPLELKVAFYATPDSLPAGCICDPKLPETRHICPTYRPLFATFVISWSMTAERHINKLGAQFLQASVERGLTASFCLQDIKGFIYEFCRDQHGSRFIQQKLVEGPPEQLMQLYEEIQPHVIALMQDVFGNYVIQKCFEHGSQVSCHMCADDITTILSTAVITVSVFTAIIFVSV